MKICVIYPPYQTIKYEPSIKEISNNYGVYPSLSLGYAAAIMEEAGHKIRYIDAEALNLTKEETLKQIIGFKPDLLCFTVTTYLFHQNLEWISYLKENTNIPILVGGVHVGIYPKETLFHKQIDYGYMGEAEIHLPKFLDALEKGKSLKKISNIVYREKEKIIINEKGPVLEDIDKSPFPARHLMPNDKYFEIISQRKNFTGLMSSRGCPFKCIYCEQGGQKFRFRSADNIVQEFEECYKKYKVREIDIFDSSFTVIKKRVLEICKKLKEKNLDIHWAARSRVDLVDREMLNAMHEAGCKRIYYGIESGNPTILQTLKKETNLGKIKYAISQTKKAGINTFGYFMLGCPGETKETMKQTIKFAKSLDLDYAQFNRVIPMAATELYSMLLKETNEDYWAKYTLDEKSVGILKRPSTNLTDEEVDYYTRKAYKSFYFRPKYVMKATLRVKSFDEFQRNAKAALDLLTKKEIE